MSSNSVFDKVGMFVKDDDKPKVQISNVLYVSGYPEHMRIIEIFYKENGIEKSYGIMEEEDFLKKVSVHGGKGKRNTKKARRSKKKRFTRYHRIVKK